MALVSFRILKKHTKMGLIFTAILLLLAALLYFFRPPNDACTKHDRAINNCVPAGRCTPPGSALEQVVDCNITGYDRKYNLDAK